MGHGWAMANCKKLATGYPLVIQHSYSLNHLSIPKTHHFYEHFQKLFSHSQSVFPINHHFPIYFQYFPNISHTFPIYFPSCLGSSDPYLAVSFSGSRSHCSLLDLLSEAPIDRRRCAREAQSETSLGAGLEERQVCLVLIWDIWDIYGYLCWFRWLHNA